MTAHWIAMLFREHGTYELRRLTSVTPRPELANLYAVSKARDVARWTNEIQQPVILRFSSPHALTGVAIPDVCLPVPFEERILPKGAVYAVTAVERDDAIVRVELSERRRA